MPNSVRLSRWWPLLMLLPAVFVLALLTGCPGRRNPTSRAAVERDKDDALSAVRDTLRRDVQVDDCKTAVAQLNIYLGRSPDTKPEPLTAAQLEILKNELKLTEDELNEVTRDVFGTLDAHHLASCFLFHDAVVSLKFGEADDDAAKRDRARQTFEWAMRQVFLLDVPGQSVPAAEALRLGRFNADGRAAVAMAALRQAGFEPSLIGTGSGKPPLRAWAIGVPIGSEVYLFDPRAGKPLMDGQAIATLKQVRAKPELAKSALAAAGETGEPKAAVEASRVWLCPPLTTLAPRMRWLQQVLGFNPPITLGVDPVAVVATYTAAGEKPGWWNPPGDTNNPVRRLISFLPPEEGGTAKPVRGAMRLYDVYREEVWPFTQFPAVLRRELNQTNLSERIIALFRNRFVELALDPGGARDLALRGRFDEASRKLTEALDRTNRAQQRIGAEKNLEAGALEWLRDVRRAQAEASEIRQGRKAGSLLEAENRVESLMKTAEKAILLIEQAAAEPYSAAVIYELALCMHEQAVRRAGDRSSAEAKKEAWETAAGWWNNYLSRFGNVSWVKPEQIAHAKALQAAAQAAAK